MSSLSFNTAPDTPANGNLAEHVCRGDLEEVESEVTLHFARILSALRIDLNDPNVINTPRRYAKMLVREVCRGRFEEPPKITVFPNTRELDEMVATGPISVRSLCSHHFCPIVGKCWIGIIPGATLAGLSKFDRIVDWFAARPQIQEELAVQVADYIVEKLAPVGVAVVIEAVHSCKTWRGVKSNDEDRMATNVMRGVFRDKPEARSEFLQFVRGR